jgi:hypothetical protein
MKNHASRTYLCSRCSHEWYPRQPGRPLTCPKCKSPYWDRARRGADNPDEDHFSGTVGLNTVVYLHLKDGSRVEVQPDLLTGAWRATLPAGSLSHLSVEPLQATSYSLQIGPDTYTYNVQV